MRLVYYALLAAFHCGIFATWTKGADPTFTAFATPEFAAFEAAPSAAAPVVRTPPATLTPATPEGFRQALANGTIVEYRGGSWRVVPPAPSQYHQPAAPAVAARPFRAGLRYDPDHQCDNCGASQYYISGRGPGGAHTHRCGRCGQSWYHRRRVPKRLRVKLN